MIELQGVSQIVNHVALSADGAFAAGGGDDAAYCWNLRDRSVRGVGVRRSGALTTGVGFTGDSRYFVFFGLTPVGSMAFDLITSQCIEFPRNDFDFGAVSPTERTIARFGPFSESHSISDDRVIWRLRSTRRFCPWAAYNSEGTEIFTPDHDFLIVLRASDGVYLRELEVPIPRSWRNALSPDAHRIAYCDRRHVLIYDVNSGKLVAPLHTGGRHFTAVAFHPSGEFIATTSNDTTVRIWDTTSWREVTAFTWDAGRMRSVCFAPDGLRMAAGTDKGKVVIWDADL